MKSYLRVAVKKGHHGLDAPLEKWVMLASQPDEEPEFGTWLTPTQARKLAERLIRAADKAEGIKSEVLGVPPLDDI